MRHPHINREFLLKGYIEERLSVIALAARAGCSPQLIAKRLAEHEIPRRSPSTKKDLTGQKFGRWRVLEKVKTVRGTILYKCRCDCGAVKNVRHSHLERGWRRACIRCAHPGSYKHSRWKGHGEISARKWREIISNATRRGTRSLRGVKFEITIQFAWTLFLQQEGRCSLSGWPIRFQKDYKDRGGCTASLDRIDSLKGYTENNVQWVHKDINLMKNKFSQDYFLGACRAVVANHL